MGPRTTMFTVLPTWMGSASVTSDRAKSAVQEYESLVSRVGGIANDAERSKILDWIGSWNSPGSPAERYAVVASDLRDVQPDPVLQAKRVTDLEDVLMEFRPKVAAAESAFGTVTSADRGEVATASGELTGKGVAMAVVAIGALLVPFLMD